MTSLLQRGCVKSVQRGYKFVSRDEFKEENNQLIINISPINPNKSLILYHTNYNNNVPINVELLQSSIVIPDLQWQSPDLWINYQVVEFY